MILALLALLPAKLETVTMDVYRDGSLVGTATFQTGSAADGGRSTSLKLIVKSGVMKGQVVTQNQLVDKSGRQKTCSLTQYSGGVPSTDAKALIGVSGAVDVTQDDHGKKSHIHVDPPKGNRSDSSEFWFVLTKPSKGTTVEYENFDLGTMKWEHVKTVYIGRTKVALHGKSVEANSVRQERSGNVEKVWVDDHGLPVAFELGGIRLEKH